MTAADQFKPRRIAVTGAAGSLAADILPGLGESYQVVGIDTRPRPAGLTCDWAQCSVNDRERLLRAFEGCDAVVHLAGIPLEAEWDELLHANIDGTQAVLEMARVQGISRVVLAGSIHATGFTAVPDEEHPVPDDVEVRPDTYYGVSKAAMEALAGLYHHRHGMDVVCLRIASRFPRPSSERMLSTWLSPSDALRLMRAALTTNAPGFRIVWGVSANSRGYLGSGGGAAIGFRPRDNAEDFAAELLGASQQDPAVLASDWDRRYIGGDFCSPHPPMMDR